MDRLPSGSYRARLTVDGVKYTATFVTEREAGEWLVVTRGRAAGVRSARTLTVEEYARRWLGEFIDAADDFDRYRRDVAEYLVPATGSRLLVEVTPADVVEMLDRVCSEVSPAGAEQVWAALRELFTDATLTRTPWLRQHRSSVPTP